MVGNCTIISGINNRENYSEHNKRFSSEKQISRISFEAVFNFAINFYSNERWLKKTKV